ncbi:NADH-quinone oxidoreductase subunit NuoF [Carboxydochorda subterranea]|uniref:NADH-quinone oxidoreductase subunit NuoF n=1 Tax=Carboxydichorda subterranea TaxID=3109565 RepID=A0ABZ1C113_9FIRM|nr:NADH-quinone oxidoreductase subunit NuoF [Limnochorda sp. L945t]WRP18791.1 NADH-quinone oxidoreductase subunit NuoF [Limnochorda sp. L945t]
MTDAPVEVRVGAGSCGLAAGAERVIEALQQALQEAGVSATVRRVGCMGLCEREVLVDVRRPGAATLTFGPVSPDAARRLVDRYVVHGVVPEDLLVGVALGEPPGDVEAPVERGPAAGRGNGREAGNAEARAAGAPAAAACVQVLPRVDQLPLMQKQQRIVLANCGRIDPTRIDEYVAAGGYRALEKALRSMTPEQVLAEIERSDLRGRGGAGFPTGRKWRMASQQPDPERYVVCNADEGDPGAFMDRSVLEGDPHRVLEGMALAAYAIGARHGYIYVRAEYPLAVERIQKAILQAEEYNFLGRRILGSDFEFTIEVKIGAGAFVCGEETALLASVEGRRGMPRPRPPYPVVSGLWAHPTVINNVETLANVPAIIERGADWFRSIGTATSKGTKVFALTGDVVNSGLIEVPMGVTLREIVYEVGGGIRDGRHFKAAQIGGPSGGCLPESLLDTPIDYESLMTTGAIMGSGGLVVMDSSKCMVDVARFFLDFLRHESCGKCVPCREGTTRLHEMLERIVSPPGGRPKRVSRQEAEAILDEIESLGTLLKMTAACGLGQTAANPVLSTLRYFRDEYVAHLVEGRCPARRCGPYLTYRINPALCPGCGVCARSCLQEAIVGEKRQPYTILDERCIRCGTCVEVCRFGAVEVA